MRYQPIKREHTDTFGRNTKADLELLRRIAERNNDRSEEIFALFAVMAAVAIFFGMVGVVAWAIFN